MTVLEAVDVSKTYNERPILRGVSLGIARGQVKVIVGPSGSGKSTLLRCLALLEAVDGGEVRLEGERVGQRLKNGEWVPQRERELAQHRGEIGMVFQRFNLFPHMNATENVMCAQVEVRKTPKAQARERAQEFLERVGLGHRLEAYPSELSGGEQQRVAMARALVMRPKVLLFDEPTSALDAELVREVLEVMEDLAKSGMTMLVVTHELAFARHAASSICMMDDGVLIEEQAPDGFFASPQHERTRRFLAHLET